MIAQKETKLSEERFVSSSLWCGIPKGAITEIIGTAKIEWILSFLRENPDIKVLWIEEKFLLNPPSIYQRGIDLNRFLFVECGPELYETVRKALQFQVFGCIILPSAFSDLRILKAVQLLSERSHSSVILLADKLQSSWPISVQFEVHWSNGWNNFNIKIHKNKRGKNSY